jgi:hypothetical protein
VDDSGGFPSARLTTSSSSSVVHRGWSANLGGSPSRSADQPTRKPLARLGRGQTPDPAGLRNVRRGRSASSPGTSRPQVLCCGTWRTWPIAQFRSQPPIGETASPRRYAASGCTVSSPPMCIDAHPGGHRRAASAPARYSLLRWPHRTVAAHARVERSRQAPSVQRGAPIPNAVHLDTHARRPAGPLGVRSCRRPRRP